VAKCRDIPTAFMARFIEYFLILNIIAQAKRKSALTTRSCQQPSTSKSRHIDCQFVSRKPTYSDAENTQTRSHSCPDPRESPIVYNCQQYTVQEHSHLCVRIRIRCT
jgi:hypothetical protein